MITSKTNRYCVSGVEGAYLVMVNGESVLAYADTESEAWALAYAFAKAGKRAFADTKKALNQKRRE